MTIGRLVHINIGHLVHTRQDNQTLLETHLVQDNRSLIRQDNLTHITIGHLVHTTQDNLTLLETHLVQEILSLIMLDNLTLLETHLVQDNRLLINIERLRLQTVGLLQLIHSEIRLVLVVAEAELASLQVQ